MSDPLPHVDLFTDGACSGNPGPGGWGYLLRHAASGRSHEDSGGEPHTTNNRMELTAVIKGLEALTRPSRVALHSDSQYVLKGLSQWMKGWKARGWRTADKKPVKNQELWEKLDVLQSTHQLSFHWVEGHTGHADNERVDTLAVRAREQIAPK